MGYGPHFFDFRSATVGLGWLLRGNFMGLVIGGFGLLLVVLGLRRTVVMELKTKDELWHRHSLREIVQRDQLCGLEFLIRKHLPRWVTLSIEAA